MSQYTQRKQVYECLLGGRFRQDSVAVQQRQAVEFTYDHKKDFCVAVSG
jgi:hypothetical protein